MKKINYIVYQITNKLNNNIYIGVHITKNLNDNYMGSGTNIGKAIKEFGRENFNKIILYNFDNKEDMFSKEREIVNEKFINRNNTYNIILGGGTFSTFGNTPVKDKNGKFSMVSINNPKYLSGELVGVNKGKTTVKDKNDNSFSISINNSEYLNGAYDHITKNMVVVKNKEGETFQVPVNDPRYLSGELKFITTDKTNVKDKDGNRFQVSINDTRFLSGELVGVTKGSKHTKKSIEKMKKSFEKINHQQGKNHSQYGTCWITNEKENKKIHKGDLIPDGWKLGRTMKKDFALL